MPNGSTRLFQCCEPGLRSTIVESQSCSEIHLTLNLLPGESLASACTRLARVLKGRNASVLKHEVFGPADLAEEGRACIQGAFGGLDWPVTWIEGGLCADQKTICGMQVTALAGRPVKSIHINQVPVARVVERDHGLTCYVGDLGPVETTDREAQALEAFDRLDLALHLAGMDLTCLKRTWFFLDRILDWYGPFNLIRDRVFREHGVFAGLLPASTGVAGKAAQGSALRVSALAAVPGTGQWSEVPSPLQCPAKSYGSSFSRAVDLCVPGLRSLWVSGTASIAPEGNTVHVGDVRGQAARTLEVIQAILASRGMGLQDVTRVIAYLKTGSDALDLAPWFDSTGLSDLPLIVTQSTICREDLLFEIELDARLEAGGWRLEAGG